jgi:hypothetical protein
VNRNNIHQSNLRQRSATDQGERAESP